MRASTIRLLAPAAILATLAAPAFAGDAIATLHCRSSTGATTVGVRPGGTFAVRVELESELPIAYNSAVFRLVLSREGLAIGDYAWGAPFETGGATDFSLLGVELPATIDADTLAGPTYPAETVDIEFANFLVTGEAEPGAVVEVELAVPAKTAPGETFFVVAVPDTFAFGFLEIPTEAETVLTVRTTFSPDFDGDGQVNAADLAIYLGLWGSPDGDLNGDGLSNSADLAILLGNWT
ncbi:MAG: hypothetical protein RI967_1261 [Planctomycetota bacterium]|jgi:hypothetical protein